jgi:hypothetical protein
VDAVMGTRRLLALEWGGNFLLQRLGESHVVERGDLIVRKIHH